ncbi:MAG: hypothetical protein Q4F95_11045 [Oscillospiraceae bacterium]|nr:hypothetical protein [Oscillospiraceae bacterium]
MALIINDDGIYDSETFSLSCTDSMLAGNCVGSLFHDIAAGYDTAEPPAAFYSMCAGILSSGSGIWNLGRCTQAQLRYAVQTAKLDAAMYIESSYGSSKVIVYSKSGFSLNTSEEKTISELLHSRNMITGEKEGTMTDAQTLKSIYRSEIKAACPSLPEDTEIKINSSNASIKTFLSDLISDRSPDTQSRKNLIFQISGDGLRASAYSFETGFVFYERLILLCCMDEFEKGNDIPLPYDFPVIADAIADKHHRKVYRYDPCSDNPSELSKKNISAEFSFLNDAAALIMKILTVMNEKKMSFFELMSRIPLFTTTVKYISIDNNHTESIEKVRNNAQKNVCYSDDNGRIIAKNSKSGKSLILYAESYREETADELCRTWMMNSDIRP